MFKRAVDLEPSNANNLANFALFEYARGRLEDAKALVGRALAASDASSQPSLRVELQLHRWAAGDPEIRAEARAETQRLIEEGARSPDWDFEPVLAIARRQRRDDLAALEEAAAAISAT